jgi:hypothetical protein
MIANALTHVSIYFCMSWLVFGYSLQNYTSPMLMTNGDYIIESTCNVKNKQYKFRRLYIKIKD